MDNYNKIIEAFKNGKVVDLAEQDLIPGYLQTEISHIFLFPQRVYKFYRRDSKGFNEYFFNLNDDEKRRRFYQEEFSSNHYFNPKVYQSLAGLKVKGDEVFLVKNPNEGEDQVIQMARIEEDKNLTHVLLNGHLEPKDYYRIGDQMTSSLLDFNKGKKLNGDYYEIMVAFLNDLSNYLTMYEKDISKEESRQIMSGLKKFLETHQDHFAKAKEGSLIETIDNHADNTYYNDEQVSFIDAYLPKDSWRIVEPLYGVYRLLTDVAVLTSDEAAMPIFEGFQHNYPEIKFDLELDSFYKIYFSCIRMGHFFGIATNDPSSRNIANRYLKLIRNKLPTLI